MANKGEMGIWDESWDGKKRIENEPRTTREAAFHVCSGALCSPLTLPVQEERDFTSAILTSHSCKYMRSKGSRKLHRSRTPPRSTNYKSPATTVEAHCQTHSSITITCTSLLKTRIRTRLRVNRVQHLVDKDSGTIHVGG